MITEISRNEYDAICLSLDKMRLRKRLNEAKAALYDEARAMFKPGIFKPAERALYSDSPFGYRLRNGLHGRIPMRLNRMRISKPQSAVSGLSNWSGHDASASECRRVQMCSLYFLLRSRIYLDV